MPPNSFRTTNSWLKPTRRISPLSPGEANATSHPSWWKPYANWLKCEEPPRNTSLPSPPPTLNGFVSAKVCARKTRPVTLGFPMAIDKAGHILTAAEIFDLVREDLQ